MNKIDTEFSFILYVPLIEFYNRAFLIIALRCSAGIVKLLCYRHIAPLEQELRLSVC